MVVEPSVAVTVVSTELVFVTRRWNGLPGTASPPDHWMKFAALVSGVERVACRYTQASASVFTAAQLFVPPTCVALFDTTLRDCKTTGLAWIARSQKSALLPDTVGVTSTRLLDGSLASR